MLIVFFVTFSWFLPSMALSAMPRGSGCCANSLRETTRDALFLCVFVRSDLGDEMLTDAETAQTPSQEEQTAFKHISYSKLSLVSKADPHKQIHTSRSTQADPHLTPPGRRRGSVLETSCHHAFGTYTARLKRPGKGPLPVSLATCDGDFS